MLFVDRLAEQLDAQLEKLVHPDARCDSDLATRHRLFIGSRLAVSLFSIAFAPLYLVMRGAPSLVEALAFGWTLMPLAAALVVSRTGDLMRGHGLCLAGLMGVVATLALGGASPAVLVWLVLVPFEAVFAVNRGVTSGATTTALAVAVLAGAFSGGMAIPGGSASTGQIVAFTLPAIVYGFVMSLAAHRLAELRRRAALDHQARYRNLADTIGDLVLRHDRQGAVVSASNEGALFKALPPRDLNGRGFFERIHVGDRPAFLRAIADAADGEATVTAALRLRTGSAPSDRGFDEPVFSHVELRARRASEEGERAAVISVVRDVTALRIREVEIDASRREAEKANMWKDRFLANVSHELRTPLNAIIGFSEMLASAQLAPADPERRREYAQIIHSSGEHLLSVVNSILDMSKIEAGSFDLHPETFEVAPLIDSVLDMMKLKVEQSGIAIALDVSPAVKEIVADKRACKQVLINLVSNAVKFTPGGRVTISARPEGNSILLSVADTGIGIDAPDLPRLGDPFFQARGSYDRPYEGTGLGLSLVRGLVGLHGGSISIESAPSEGTRVNVRLPLDCRHAQALGAPARIETIARRSGPAPTILSDMSTVKKIA